MKIFANLLELENDYEPIKTSIDRSMDATHTPMLDDDILPRLTAFDDRLQSYLVDTGLTPHLAVKPLEKDHSSPEAEEEVVVDVILLHQRPRLSSTHIIIVILQIQCLLMVTPDVCVKSVERLVMLPSGAGTDLITLTNWMKCIMLSQVFASQRFRTNFWS